MLTLFYLNNNPIGDEGAKLIAEAVKSDTTLKSLNLRKKDIGVEGAQAIGDALKSDTTLTSLNLCENDIGVEGAQAIAEALKRNTTLESLDLPYNNIGVKGAQAIANMLKINTTLKSLYLALNMISTKGAQAFAEALKRNTTLKSLDLSHNKIGPKGGEAIANMLKINTTIISINLDHNNISTEETQAIHDLLEGNQLKKREKEAALKKHFSKIYVFQKQNLFENSIPLPYEALNKISAYTFENISPPLQVALSDLCRTLAYLENAHNISKLKKEKLNIDTAILEHYNGEESIVLWKTMMQLFCRYGTIARLDDLSKHLEKYQPGLTQLLLQENYPSAESVSENFKVVSLYTWAAQCGLGEEKVEAIFTLDKRRQPEETLVDFIRRHRPNEETFFLKKECSVESFKTSKAPEEKGYPQLLESQESLQSSGIASPASFFSKPKEAPPLIDLESSYAEAEKKIETACSDNQDMLKEHLNSLEKQFHKKCHKEEEQEAEDEQKISASLDTFVSQIINGPTRDNSSKLR